MSPVYPTLPRLAVRDSFDDEDLSDVDDEVFIRDGKNGGLKLDDEGGVKRPLMAPRRKFKSHHRSVERKKITCKSLLAPCCYASIALLVLTGLITLVIFAVSVFPVPLTFIKNWISENMKDKSALQAHDIAACTSLDAKIVWTKSLPKLTSETPLRSLDVNGDNVQDIIVAYSTGLNDVETPEYVCNVYFGGQTPCLGGIMALDGNSGDTLWTHWTWQVIFSLDCVLDLNNDGVKDCVAAGRGGTLRAVSGRDGSTIWVSSTEDEKSSSRRRILDVYDASYVPDVDGDDIGDVLAAHTVQIGPKRMSEVVIVSGKNGRTIRRIPLMNKEEVYLAPQTLVHPDGEKILVVVTGSHEKPGGVYVSPFSDVLHGKLKLRALHRDSETGVLCQPILADVNEDGTEDIVLAMFNSVIAAYDGRTFVQIWNYTVSNSEIISSPIPGYYNDDGVPDFMVKNQLGPGFPVYYYTVATILDGKSGEPLLEKELEDSLSGQMSGLSITVDGYGNDWFLHWSADCLSHEGDRSPYQYLKSTNLPSQMGADLCKLRFNSSLSTKLLALSQHTAPPGLPLYNSEEFRKLEYNSSIDARKEAERYSEMHPDYEGISSITERSLRVHTNRRGRPLQSEGDGFSEKNDNLRDGGRDALANNPETNVSDDFGSNEDWRDVNKWEEDDDNNDYNVLYDDGNDLDKINGIREQRSGAVASKVNKNASNDEKNEFDSSMDYTNGRNADNPRSPGVNNNRSKNVLPEMPDASDFDFDENINDEDSARIERKREITEFGIENAGAEGQMNESESFTGRINKVNKTNFLPKEMTENDESVPTKDGESKTKDSLLARDIFSKLMSNGEEDDNIEKIFKRESMKNRKGFERNRLTNIERAKAGIKAKSKREVKGEKAKSKIAESETDNFDGVQRQPPTGILLPSLNRIKKVSNSIDLVFSTSWLPPSDASAVLIQQDLDCLARKRKESSNSDPREAKNQQQRAQFVLECLSERGIDHKVIQEGTDRENLKIPLGQMTVYRMKLECVCPEDMLKGQTCRSISSAQSWPANLGPLTNGYFKPLRKPAS